MSTTSFHTSSCSDGDSAEQFINAPKGLPLKESAVLRRLHAQLRVVWGLLNILLFDDQGRLVEEWIRTDYRSFLRQLGAQGK